MKFKKQKDFINFIYEDLNHSISKEEIEQVILLFLDKFRDKLLLGYQFKIRNFGTIKNRIYKPQPYWDVVKKVMSIRPNYTNHINIYFSRDFKRFLNQYLTKGNSNHGHSNE